MWFLRFVVHKYLHRVACRACHERVTQCYKAQYIANSGSELLFIR